MPSERTRRRTSGSEKYHFTLSKARAPATIAPVFETRSAIAGRLLCRADGGGVIRRISPPCHMTAHPPKPRVQLEECEHHPRSRGVRSHKCPDVPFESLRRALCRQCSNGSAERMEEHSEIWNPQREITFCHRKVCSALCIKNSKQHQKLLTVYAGS